MGSSNCMIWGAGYCGGIALEAYGSENVICFGDSDGRNVGLNRWGKPIISYEEMIKRAKNENIRIIAASEDYAEEMECLLRDENIVNYDLFVSECARDIIADRRIGINPVKKRYYGTARPLFHKELKQFHNCHSKKRIFLIGNGPSLQASDLDILHSNQEICFGFNSIYSIFDRTKWRPNYYGISDYYGFLISREVIRDIPGIHFFWDVFQAFFPEMNNEFNNYFFGFIREGYSYDEMPAFSDDISHGLYLGYSVVYDIGLQVAAYMGANEIYLLGMDHYQPNKKGHEGNHFKGCISNSEEAIGGYRFYPVQKTKKGYDTKRVEKAFERAEKYSREHDFRIFNATRGGKLEVFERVRFDDLFC